MNPKNKILILGASVFILVVAIWGVYSNTVCDPDWQTMQENLDYIRKENTIKKIQLYKESDYPNTHLTQDTVTITNADDIALIQRMINARYPGTWDHPVQRWSTYIRLVLDNQKTIEFRVSKISNAESVNMTHLYFNSKNCTVGASPTCSETLGNYLERLTSYRENSAIDTLFIKNYLNNPVDFGNTGAIKDECMVLNTSGTVFPRNRSRCLYILGEDTLASIVFTSFKTDSTWRPGTNGFEVEKFECRDKRMPFVYGLGIGANITDFEKHFGSFEIRDQRIYAKSFVIENQEIELTAEVDNNEVAGIIITALNHP